MLARWPALAGAAVIGATAVALAWWIAGSGGGVGAASFEPDPGIPPPDYVYLDEARVASYLGQIEGGIAASEKVTEQISRSGSAGANAAGLGLTASVARTASLERVVTPTAAARFYALVALLRSHGYLQTIDAGQPARTLVRAFGEVGQGSFVLLRNCRLRLPSYVQLDLLLRQSRGRLSPLDAFRQATSELPGAALWAVSAARHQAGRSKGVVDSGSATVGARDAARLRAAASRLVSALGGDPRLPLATCSGGLGLRPRGVDLLMAIGLGSLSPDRSLIAGPVTVVGKVVRVVHNGSEIYADEQSLTAYAGPLAQFDDALKPTGYLHVSLEDELAADTVVLPPGVVILPLAIYK